MRLLIIGASGQVGHHLMQAAAARGDEATGTYSAHPGGALLPLDIRDAAAVQDTVRAVDAEWVLVPAALGNAERCEAEPEAAAQINVAGVENVARAAARTGARLGYFSSDYVFDGRDGPYDEQALPAPICQYGHQKLAAERAVAALVPDALIVRTTVVYGWEPQGKNFVYRLLGALEDGAPLRVPYDQVGTPTYAPALAHATLRLMDAEVGGIWNVVGSERVDRAEFAREAARVFGGDPGLVEEVDTASLAQLAPRPLQAGLKVDKAAALVPDLLLGYREGLRRMASERPQPTPVTPARG